MVSRAMNTRARKRSERERTKWVRCGECYTVRTLAKAAGALEGRGDGPAIEPEDV
jgi:hypothetical protein